jgi:hypothetical protein
MTLAELIPVLTVPVTFVMLPICFKRSRVAINYIRTVMVVFCAAYIYMVTR